MPFTALSYSLCHAESLSKGCQLHISGQSWGSLGFLMRYWFSQQQWGKKINKHGSLNVGEQVNLKRVCNLGAAKNVPCILNSVQCYMVMIHVTVMSFSWIYTQKLNNLEIFGSECAGVLGNGIVFYLACYFKWALQIQYAVPIILHKMLLVHRNMISVYCIGPLGLL